MTTSQLKHHLEQMEGARLEFRQIWRTLEPELRNAGRGGLARLHIERCCWLTFLAAKGLTQQTAKGLAGEK